MTGTATGASGFDPLDASVDALCASDPASWSSLELVDALSRIGALRNRVAAFEARVVAEIETQRLAGEYGRASTADLLVSSQRITPGQARATVERASCLAPRRTLHGEPLPPVTPVLAAACADGVVSPAHADVALTCLDRLPTDLPAQAWPVVERLLVDAAHIENPAQLAGTARAVLARLNPDGSAPAEQQRRRRGFTLSRHADGTATATGFLTPDTAEALTVVLDALSAPAPAAAGEPDPRTATQRRHDALHDMALRLLRSNTLPASGGLPVTILATCTLTDLTTTLTGSSNADSSGSSSLGNGGAGGSGTGGAGSSAGGSDGVVRTSDGDTAQTVGASAATGSGVPGSDATGDGGSGSCDPVTRAGGGGTGRVKTGVNLNVAGSGVPGYARTGHGTLISITDLLRLAGDELQIVPVLFDGSGAALAMGRTCRFATGPQRLALAARDGGCSFPGCTRPAAWCEVDHVTRWTDGGTTDIDLLHLLCGHHHRTFTRAGWQVRMSDGRPEWLAPPWLDPSQTWQRNHAHHPPDLTFTWPDTPDVA